MMCFLLSIHFIKANEKAVEALITFTRIKVHLLDEFYSVLAHVRRSEEYTR